MLNGRGVFKLGLIASLAFGTATALAQPADAPAAEPAEPEAPAEAPSTPPEPPPEPDAPAAPAPIPPPPEQAPASAGAAEPPPPPATPPPTSEAPGEPPPPPAPPPEPTNEAEEPGTFGMPTNEPQRMKGSKVGADSIAFKPGKGLVVKSDDGDYKLGTRIRVQLLYSLVSEEETLHSLQVRRARLTFKGNAFGKHNKFKLELAFAPRDIGLDLGDGTLSKGPLLDWYAEFDYLRDLTLRVGQYKVPYNRQRVTSSGNLELVDRSIANGEFTLDRDLGLDLRSKDLFGLDLLRYQLGAFIGEGHSARSLEDIDLMYVARLEVLPLGMFDDYVEADHERLSRPRVALGVAYAYLDEGKRNRGIVGSTPSDAGTTDTSNITVDLMFKYAGFSATGAYFWREGERNPGPLVDDMGMPILDPDGNPITVEDPRDGFGYFAQLGFLVPHAPIGLAGRFEQFEPQGTSSLPARRAVGGGLSYYVLRHPFKLQADYFRLWEDDAISDGVDQFRMQLQFGL